MAPILTLHLLTTAGKLRSVLPWARVRRTAPFLSVIAGSLCCCRHSEFPRRTKVLVAREMTKGLSSVELSGVHAYGKGSKFIWTATLIGIAILLLALALLQYRWNAQIRQAAEVRAGAELESVMMKWRLDLYGELSTICIALQVGPDSGAHDGWDDYLQRYSRWRHAGSSSSETRSADFRSPCLLRWSIPLR